MATSSELMGKLQALGLTENECKAYLAVLKLGACTAVQVSRESHLQRTEVYPLMSRLVTKGLVEETIDRPKRYRPADTKIALPHLAAKIRKQLDTITRESEQLASELEGLATKPDRRNQEEVRIIYGPNPGRAHLLESVKSVETGFWGMAGRKRPPHVSNRLLTECLRLIASKGVKARLIFEIDKENLSRVRKMTTVAEVGHYQPIPVYMYGADDKSVAVSLAQEPIGRPSQIVQLASTYRPTVQVMRQFFNILWREATPFAVREAMLLGRPLSGEISRVIRGREEAYIQTENEINAAKESIKFYAPTRYGPVRLLKGLSETYLRAHKRGLRIQIICKLSDHNTTAAKALAKFAEVRHTENPIGFCMGIMDDTGGTIYHPDPDSPQLESRADCMIRITSKDGIRHLNNIFDSIWQESSPIEEQLERIERLQDESSKPHG